MTSRLLDAISARTAAAGLTARELAEAIGPLTTTRALTAARAHTRGTLLLLGDPGAGKTLGAVRWMLEPLIDLERWEHDNGRWYPLRPYSMMFRTAKSLARVKQYDPRELDVLFDVRRLVLDDMGQEFLDKAGFLASLVDEIVTERHRRERKTVLTANLSVRDFVARYGERVFDRVRGDGDVVICSGDSLRGRGHEPDFAPAIAEKDVARRARACAERQLRDALERQAAWAASEAARGPVVLGRPRPAPVEMTREDVEAKKLEISRQLQDWTARNIET